MDNAYAQLLDQVVFQLAKAGVHARVLADQPDPTAQWRQDTLIALNYRNNPEETRRVLIKTHVTAATLGAIQTQIQGRANAPIIFTDHITRALAKRLREAGVQFADTAGNAYIEAEHFLVNLTGENKPQARIKGLATGRAFEPGGLRTLFVLITEPHYLNKTYREIAKAAGVAHGTVGWAMADLAARGFLIEIDHRVEKRRRLINVDKLIAQWAEAYARTMRPKCLLARYRVDEFHQFVANVRLKPGVLIGGEVAAARITGYLKPATATFWVEKIDPGFLVGNRLILDPLGPIELMEKFWVNTHPNTELAPHLLIYADLLAIGDARTVETAEMLRDEIYDRLVRQG